MTGNVPAVSTYQEATMTHIISREGWRPTVTSEIKYGDAVRWHSRVNRRVCFENFGIVQNVEAVNNDMTSLDIKQTGGTTSMVVARTNEVVFDRYERDDKS